MYWYRRNERKKQRKKHINGRKRVNCNVEKGIVQEGGEGGRNKMKLVSPEHWCTKIGVFCYMQNNSIQRVCRPIKDETEIFFKDSTSFVRNSLQTQFKFTYVYPSLRWLLT